MSKPKLSAKEVVQDIRAGMTDGELMAKYNLSAKGLQSVFQKLIDAGILISAELECRMPSAQQRVEAAWTCPDCKTIQQSAYDECPQCGFIVPKPRGETNVSPSPDANTPPRSPSMIQPASIGNRNFAVVTIIFAVVIMA
jgi:hypothetical protein